MATAMDPFLRKWTLLGAAVMCSLCLLAARAGCEMGLTRKDARLQAASDATLALAAVPIGDRGGAGLDTGMPYYSFANRN